jgi:Terminase large subunit, T4likevirus-type, N-terminal
MNEDAIKEELEWRKICKHPSGLIPHWSIAIPGQGIVAWKPYEEQVELLSTFVDNVNTLILKARQIGISTTIAFFACWYALTHPDSRIVLVSRNQKEAEKLVKKINQGYKLLPQWIKNRVQIRGDMNSKKQLGFTNGSEIESIPSRENAARGDSVDIIFVDEWAFLNDPEEAWKAIEPTADVGGKIIGLSTSDGYGSWWYNMCQAAKLGKNNFKYVFLGWNVAKHRDQNWYDAKRAGAIDVATFESEYAADDVSCWLKTGSPVFDLEKLPEEDKMKTPIASYLVNGWSFDELVKDDHAGPLTVFEIPIEGRKYLVSGDSAAGGPKSDYNSMHILGRNDWGKLYVAAVWHGKCDTEVFAKELAKVGKIYNDALVVPERDGQYGNAVCNYLEDVAICGRVNLYYTQDAKGNRKYAGFLTGDSKAYMIANIRTLLYDNMIHLNDIMTLFELRTFSNLKGGKMGASRGNNDDRVMSLAIACYAALTNLKHKVKKEPPPVNESLGLGMSFGDWFPETSIRKTQYVSRAG